MLSEYGFELATLLRQYVGSDSVGVGPGRRQLAELWRDLPADELRPAVEELAACRFIGVDRTHSGPTTRRTPGEFNFEGMVGVRVMEPMQRYFDRIDAGYRPSVKQGVTYVASPRPRKIRNPLGRRRRG